MDATCGAEPSYPLGEPEITPVFCGVCVAQSSVFYVVYIIACLGIFLFFASALSYTFD